MAHGPIPDGELAREVKRLGFELTPAQIRYLEADFADGLYRVGEQWGMQQQAAAHAIRKAGYEFGKRLAAEFDALQKAAVR